MAAREIPGLATVLGRIDGAMAPAAAWCERHVVAAGAEPVRWNALLD